MAYDVVHFLQGGGACMVAAAVTNPIDVIKVRLQLRGEQQQSSASRSGLRRAVQIVTHEGVSGLYKGLTASLLREATYSTLRMGLYEPCKDLLQPLSQSKELPLLLKIVAGGISGATGAAIANPTDLIKVRMQASAAGPARYTSTLQAFTSIVREEGIVGLYRGVWPTTQRAVILTASQLPSYDHTKRSVLKHFGWKDGLHVHVFSSMVAGLVCALTTSPIDLVKSRYMNQKFDPQTRKGLKYSSTFDCFRKTIASEGFLGVYSGFFYNWIRLGPHTIVTFVVLELFRKLSGHKPV